ncbi:hypothetical protein Isop_1904 [Isosphaera pallida ATCC 43644]|jgi:hypothetical protein|uniref:Oligosaccharide repeat unit polymerase n=1 Tax=Isosphaera pallida (strain ATCC 43644 / DSM 9630 / IS1B) TaxID=575540 RepID=E8R2I4_ISOPI|nr:hypothetical protein [Isosphaera pallida]ADV62484.1 hypothetical protein Isop_1904 [Isosphaera pallida ATCC 43644]
MDGRGYAIAVGATIALTLLIHLVRRRFDPFEPLWLFLVGYTQLYVIQPLSYYDWALGVRGEELVNLAGLRSLWALWVFLAAYHLIPTRVVTGLIPAPPRVWSRVLVWALAPLLIAWGLFCALTLISQNVAGAAASDEGRLLSSFPAVMLVGGVLFLVTGRVTRGAWLELILGTGTILAYAAIWMFNGKRSHSLLGLLTLVAAWYMTRGKRPSWPMLMLTGFLGASMVTLAIGWRNAVDYPRDLNGFLAFITNYDPADILVNLNMADAEGADTRKLVTYETEEWGGYLLMLDAVTEPDQHDYGAPYLRLVTTFIPRIVWPDKPLPGRDKWIQAWQRGSQLKRADDFTGPAIGILGALHLNGGATATALMMTFLGFFLSTIFAYVKRYTDRPWILAFWPMFMLNAWFMTVNDDPFVWFYYNWGFTSFPTVLFLFLANKVFDPSSTANP